MNETKPRTMGIKKILGYCDLTRTQLYGLIRNHEVVSYKIGRRRLVDVKSMDKYLDSKTSPLPGK